MKVRTKISLTVFTVTTVVLCQLLCHFNGAVGEFSKDLIITTQLEEYLPIGYLRETVEVVILRIGMFNDEYEIQQRYFQPICEISRTYVSLVWSFFEGLFDRFCAYCHANEFCTKLHTKLGPVANFVRLIKYFIESCGGFAIDSVNRRFRFGDDYSWINENGTFVRHDDMSAEDYFDIHSLDDEEDEDEEVDMDVEDREDVTMQEIDIHSILYDDIDRYGMSQYDEDLLIKKEFDAWNKAISSKLKTSVLYLHKDNNDITSSLIYEYNETWCQDNKLFLANLDEKFIDLTSSIENINCISEINPRTNEITYYDQNHNELKQYVTRPFMGKQFQKMNDNIYQYKLDMITNLDKFKKLVERESRQGKDNNIDAYEEWGDVMVTEWSKRMAYGDAMSKINAEVFQLQNWNKFIQLKKQIITMRNTLLNEHLSLTILKKYLKQMAKEIDTIVNNYDSKLTQAIKEANGQFRLREREESRQNKHIQEAIKHNIKELDLQLEWDLESLTTDEPHETLIDQIAMTLLI